MAERTKGQPQRSADGNCVFGRNPVIELLRSDKTVEKVFVLRGPREGSVKLIEAMCLEKKIPVLEAARQKLDAMSGGGNHQGVCAISADIEYTDIDSILEIAAQRGEKPFIVICDGIADPGNLGALIRCCEGAGVHGVILPKRRSAPITSAAIKASAGAIEHMALCKVSNLASCVEELKEKGLWIFACEAGGESYEKCDFDIPLAVIMGSEESGVSRLLKEKSDHIVSLPMKGRVNSLNVSCAGAVILYRILLNRSELN